MKTTKTVFYLGTDPQGVFDASSKGHKLIANSRVLDLGDERRVKINQGGFIKLDRSKELDSLSSFSLEAYVRPRQLGRRLNIIESQQPSVALFLDPQGKLVGSVHTARGWQSVDSGNKKLTTAKSSFIRFSRESSGKLILEIDEQEVGSKQVAGNITNVGKAGFFIGSGIGGRSYLFSGYLSDVRIRSGAVTNKYFQSRQNKAKLIENKFKAKLGLHNITVDLNPDESYAMLQSLKNILNAVGVQNLSDLDTLQLKARTVMVPGKVMIAPKKEKSMAAVDWAGLARSVGRLTVGEQQKLIAKYLTNRNSNKLLQAVLPPTGIGPITPPWIRTGVIDPSVTPVLPPRTPMTPITTLGGRLRYLLISARPVLADMIKLDSTKLEIKDSTIIEKLEGEHPDN